MLRAPSSQAVEEPLETELRRQTPTCPPPRRSRPSRGQRRGAMQETRVRSSGLEPRKDPGHVEPDQPKPRRDPAPPAAASAKSRRTVVTSALAPEGLAPLVDGDREKPGTDAVAIAQHPEAAPRQLPTPTARHLRRARGDSRRRRSRRGVPCRSGASWTNRIRRQPCRRQPQARAEGDNSSVDSARAARLLGRRQGLSAASAEPTASRKPGETRTRQAAPRHEQRRRPQQQWRGDLASPHVFRGSETAALLPIRPMRCRDCRPRNSRRAARCAVATVGAVIQAAGNITHPSSQTETHAEPRQEGHGAGRPTAPNKTPPTVHPSGAGLARRMRGRASICPKHPPETPLRWWRKAADTGLPSRTVPASIIVTLALVFYTISIWSEQFQGHLEPSDLVFFCRAGPPSSTHRARG